jgi:hypothetical protein
MLDITWSSGSSLLFELSPMSMNDCCASAKSADSGSVLLDVDAMDKAPRRAASSVSPMLKNSAVSFEYSRLRCCSEGRRPC